MEGRGFVVNNGTVTTPITFGAGTIATTAPDFDLSVPAGVLVIPVSFQIYFEAYGTNAQMECMAAAGGGGVIGASAVLAPVSTRIDAPIGSQCSARGPNTGTTYMTKNAQEFWRDGQQFAITKTAGSATVSAEDPYKFKWNYTDDMLPPILYDPANITRINIFAKSQAGTGFMIFKYVELPGPDIG